MPRRQRDEERDWRATLFVWRGAVSVSKSHVRWEGTWCPTDTDVLPDDGAHLASKNVFVLRTRDYRETDALEILEGCNTSNGNAANELFWGLEHLGDMKLTGSYQLDQDDGRGHQPYSDDWHDMAVSARGPYAVVAACGSTQFGRFVSLGTLDGSEMVLARRYVADDDVRAAWRTPKDVLNGTDWGILDDDEDAFQPHSVATKLPWRVEASKRSNPC